MSLKHPGIDPQEPGQFAAQTRPDADWLAARRREQRDALEQRDRKQREVEQSPDPIVRTAARARRPGLHARVQAGEAMFQSQPFEAAIREIWFADPLPAYVDWKTFVYAIGPSREFGQWLADACVPGFDVVPVLFGAPLIAERARPVLPRQRTLLRQQLAERMPPVVDHPPRVAKPMREMTIAFAHDIYDAGTPESMVALGLSDGYINGTLLIDETQGSRGARRYAEQGRARLSRLGAWPWCLTDDGKPPPSRWYGQEKYAKALALWHYQQWLATYAAMSISVDAVAQHPNGGPLLGHWARTGERAKEHARARYREDYERLT